MLGDNANVYMNIGPHRVILKVTPDGIPEMDSVYKFMVPVDKVYLFDAETEMVID